MKLRFFVWTIIGIIVVGFAIFMLSTRHRQPEPDLGNIEQQASVVSSKLRSLEHRISEAKAQLTPDQDPNAFAPVEQAMMYAGNLLTEIPEAKNTPEAMEKLTEARNHYSNAVRQYRSLVQRPRR